MSRKDTNIDDHLRTYFISMGAAFNKLGFNTMLGLPVRTIHEWMAGRRGLPRHIRPKVEAWARRYGYREDTQYDQFL